MDLQSTWGCHNADTGEGDMISDETKKNLNEAAVEVFDRMYFTPIELLSGIPPEHEWQLEEKYIKATISYSGLQKAQMELYFPVTLGINIASGFLGIAVEDLDEKEIVDTMREAANMIVGSFLGKSDPHGQCKLGIPSAEMITGFLPMANAPVGSGTLVFMSDFGFMWVFFSSNN